MAALRRSGRGGRRACGSRAARASGDSRVVRHDDDASDAARRREREKQVHDLLARRRVEVAGRLVGEQHVRVVRERARDRDALLLAARELRRQVVGARAEPDRVEQLGTRARRSRAACRVGASAASTFSRAVSVGIRLNCWNTKPSVSQPQARRARRRPAGRGRCPRTAARRTSGGRAPPSSCSSVVLPEPLGPATTRNSPRVDGEVDAVDRVDLRAALAERLRDVAQLVDGMACSCRSCSCGLGL